MDIKEENSKTSRNKLVLLILNCIVLAIGNCAGPLIMRLYFLHGGKRIWLSSWLETGGWPVILIPLAFSYFLRRRTAAKTAGTTTNLDAGTAETKLILMKPRLFAAAAVIGVFTGLDDYFYAYGVARLPVSTSSLIIASQLAFTAVFAFVLVRQKFTSYSINAIVLVTAGGAVLALHTSGDRQAGESSKEYVVGFLMTVAAAVLYGFILPVVELAYKRAKQKITYTLVMEFQLVLSFFATAFCTVGMLVNHDFKAIPREAGEFGLGETKYYVIMAWSAVIWQGFFMGAIGVIFCSSSLFSGIVIAVLLPVTEILAVITFREKFSSEKGVSLFLSLWGFVSYFYGEIKHTKKAKQQQIQMQIQQIP